MGTVGFTCGCSITTDMFNRKLYDVHHCEKHRHLRDPDKTINEMATEIVKINM